MVIKVEVKKEAKKLEGKSVSINYEYQLEKKKRSIKVLISLIYTNQFKRDGFGFTKMNAW